MSVPITAAVLYDLVNCPHRVTMDAFGDPAERDPINAFVELLWKRGSAFEDEANAYCRWVAKKIDRTTAQISNIVDVWLRSSGTLVQMRLTPDAR